MMGSLSGILHSRKIIAVSAVAVASVSADIHEKLQPSTLQHLSENTSSSSSWVSQISDSKLTNLSYVSRIKLPLPNIKNQIPNTCTSFSSSKGLSPSLINLHQSVNIIKSAKPRSYTFTAPSSTSDVLYKWHLPNPNTVNISRNYDSSSVKSKTVVVLLGWLGAKQRHLSKYAEWYTSQGYHVITFTFPMSEILSYKVGGKAEDDVELLVKHLADWLEEEPEKNLVFHTFSNTGWLTYGVMLEKIQKLNPSLMETIKGCIVDSAPEAVPDPKVFASGFSAAFLKKHSVATKGLSNLNNEEVEPKPAPVEAALLVVLKKFFEVILNLPAVNQRLCDIVELLKSKQPICPQLYMYSSADKVIPAGSVESFVEGQRKAGREVRACNFISTPHVDHFRNDPKLYTSQLTQFFDDCVV